MASRNKFSDEQLFRTKPDEYADRYVEHLLEQYKLYVVSHEKISERREGSNKFFLALHTAIVAGIVALWRGGGSSDFLLVAMTGAAIAICIYWYRSLRAYDNLNAGKFKVIHAIERRLPLALYESEWIALGRGADPELYEPVSHLERLVPWTFGLLYAVLAFVKLVW
jgi:hypothetical protein